MIAPQGTSPMKKRYEQLFTDNAEKCDKPATEDLEMPAATLKQGSER